MNKIRLGLFSFKMVNFILPEIFDSFYTLVSDVHDYDTRYSINIYLPKPRTEYRKQSISYQALQLWNSLDLSIRSANTVNSFKSRMLRSLLSANNNS